MNKNFIPNYLTLCNIFCGFMSILTTAHGYFIWGTVFIFLAMLADRYDGIVARKLGVVSEIGHDLDSLCDVVSFGVAPATLIFEIFITNDKPSITLTVIVAILCGIYVCCGAYRLARFNVTKWLLSRCPYYYLWYRFSDYRTYQVTKYCNANFISDMFLLNGK